jgi:hypothetical protein
MDAGQCSNGETREICIETRGFHEEARRQVYHVEVRRQVYHVEVRRQVY